MNMDKEQFAEGFMEIVGIANPHHLKHAMRKDTHSGYVQAQRILNGLKDLGKLERGKGVYKLPSCKSNGSPHALSISQHIAEIFNKFDNPIVFREKSIQEVALRPDILAFAIKENKGLCFVLEVVDAETEEYLKMKRNTWERWDKSTEYLSQLFAHKIRWFDFVTSHEFNTYLEEIL
jgi:hypothetical protein